MNTVPKSPSQPLEPGGLGDPADPADPNDPREVENPGDPGPNTWVPGLPSDPRRDPRLPDLDVPPPGAMR